MPALPEKAGNRAPGLDARLADRHARFATLPADTAALAEFSRVCHANGELESAAQGYRALIKLQPDEPRWPRLLAAIVAGYGRLDEAIPLLRRTTELAPNYLPAWLKLGDALLKSNATAEAELAYQQALTREPGNPFALLGLARCDLQANRLTSARSHLQQAVADHPDFASAQSVLGTVFERLGNTEAAALAQQRVQQGGHYPEVADPWVDELVADCHDPYTLLIAASAALADRKSNSAFPLLERALKLAPADARLHRQLAKTHANLGQLSEARSAMERAVALDSANEAIRLDLLAIIRQLRDDDALAAAVASGVTACPTSAALHYEAGLLASKARLFDVAVGHFKFAWTNRPDQSAAGLELAKVYFQNGQPQEAVALLLNELLVRYPQESEGWSLLVRHGIEVRDRRTSEWLQRSIDAHAPAPLVAELRDEYRRRFGETLP